MTGTRTPELADIIRQAIEDRLADVHVMLPGRIDAYDATTQKADVEPLIRRLQSVQDGEVAEDLPIIPGVPVVFPRTQAFRITMPVEPGDRCMLVFCERSIETYQTGDNRRGDNTALIKQTDPATFEMHNLSDPVAILGWYNDAEALAAPDADDLVLGEIGGAEIHVGRDLVELYERGAAEFVALAQKVLDELNSVKADFNSFKLTSETHLHGHTDNGVPLLTSPPTNNPIPPYLPLTTWPTPHTPQSVAAHKVKAT